MANKNKAVEATLYQKQTSLNIKYINEGYCYMKQAKGLVFEFTSTSDQGILNIDRILRRL